ncbi:MAG: pilus motility taxis protein HmpF [Aphanocapsa sp. GSE-SYN-MK-11-07L]|nr:pilus motility taxis protein HmpF [Aphanocapsa sp. GSE-SYN-MK-11-07L]
MLYLAEVHKKAGFMGNKVELKLLARQQAEQSWNAVPGDDMIATDAASDYNHGNLVLVEVSANRQVQTVQDATKPLVVILQNFSRMKEKFRTQEEEIEGWKQSLIYQSQELTRRELEMETRQEEIQQLEVDVQDYEQKRQDLEQLRQQVETDRQAIERNRQRLEELQAAGVGGLDPEQVQQIEQLLHRLSAGIEQAQNSAPVLNQQQSLLDQHWQTLEQQQSSAQQQQAEIETQANQLQAGWQSWHQNQAALEQARIDLKVQEQTLGLKTTSQEDLNQRMQANLALQNQLRLIAEGGAANSNSEVDYKALMQMPLNELTGVVESLRRDLAKMSSFVNDQEEELKLQQQTLEEFQRKIQRASEYERFTLEADLGAEKQSYQLLDEALQGQRQRLQERQNLLKLHESILQRRQDPNAQSEIDLEPVVQQLATQHQQLEAELQQLEAEINQIRSGLGQLQESVSRQTAEQQAKQQELDQSASSLQARRIAIAEIWGRVNTYRETLQPLQDNLNSLRQSLSSEQNGTGQQTVNQLKQLIASLNP